MTVPHSGTRNHILDGCRTFRTATLADVGNAAVFAASDMAAAMTGAALNVTCGAYLD